MLDEGSGEIRCGRALTGLENRRIRDSVAYQDVWHILEWPFIVASVRHTCAIIMLSNQHLDIPHM